MLTADTADVDFAIAGGIDIVRNLAMPNLGEVGLAMVILGVIAGGFQLHSDWVKRKGFRMVLKDRNDKKHAIMLEIIQDGLDDRLLRQEISSKEHHEMMADAAKKLNLLDLVPKKRIAPLVKESLKRDKAHREIARSKGEYKERAPIPGDKPTPIVKEKFSQKLGKSAGKFWQKSA